MQRFETHLKTRDGLRLHVCGQEPESAPKAVVCLVHGLGEHCGRYGFVAEAFTRAGIAWLAFDLRGHGRSEGKRGHAPNYEMLMADLFELLETARQRHPALPLFLYGHSLGGNLAIHYALRRQAELAGVVASAPLLRLAFEPPRWQTATLRLLHALRLQPPMPSKLDAGKLSRNPNVLEAYRSDPLVHGRITPALATAMIEKGQWNLEHAQELPCPLLLVHGGTDRITSPQASAEFAKKAGATCTLKIWDGLFHELHNEPERRQVLDSVLAWMEKTIRSGQPRQHPRIDGQADGIA